jgi:hypothetical protein
MKPLASTSWLPAVASTGVAGLGGEVVEHRGDRPVVGNRDGVTDARGSERPQQREALRRRERQVVAGTSTGLDLDDPGPHRRRLPGEQVAEVPRVDLSGQPNAAAAVRSTARRLTPAEVVVVDAVGHLVEVVLGASGDAELPYGEHGGAVRDVGAWPSMASMVRIDVTFNVTLTRSSPSTREDVDHGWAAISPEGRDAHPWCTGVDDLYRSGAADPCGPVRWSWRAQCPA